MANGADPLASPLADGDKDMLHPCPDLGDTPVASFLAGRQWLAQGTFALDAGTESQIKKTLFPLWAGVPSFIGIDLSARVPVIQYRFQALGVLDLDRVSKPPANELMPAVDADRELVPVVESKYGAVAVGLA